MQMPFDEAPSYSRPPDTLDSKTEEHREMARIKFGDIFEILTPKGLAYGQYLLRNKEYGALVRMFSGFHERRPSELAETMGDVQFICFFPLQAAVNRDIVTIIGNAPIPKEASTMPIFRSGVVNPATGKVELWWFWDGEKEWRVGATLTPEQRKMPMDGIWNDTLIIERLVEGWRPENDPR
jgi:hypothetical protein